MFVILSPRVPPAVRTQALVINVDCNFRNLNGRPQRGVLFESLCCFKHQSGLLVEQAEEDPNDEREAEEDKDELGRVGEVDPGGECQHPWQWMEVLLRRN